MSNLEAFRGVDHIRFHLGLELADKYLYLIPSNGIKFNDDFKYHFTTYDNISKFMTFGTTLKIVKIPEAEICLERNNNKVFGANHVEIVKEMDC